jgi:ribose transport system permease protein
MKKEIGIFVLLLILCAVTGLDNPRFFSGANLANTANLVGLYGIFSIGTGLVIITGGIDLSVGSLIALNGVLLVLALTEWHWPWPLAVLFAVFIPMLLGAAHGFLITKFKMQPFIVTLCGLLMYRGIARYIVHDTTKGFGDANGFESLQKFADGKFLGLPTPFTLLIIISIVMWIVLHRSVYGRYLLATGRNEEATRFSGVNTHWIIGSAYVLAGLLTGISGILFAFYTNSVSPSTHGNFYELYGIAAAVLGGCSLRGGEGSIVGILIGTALLLVLQNLVNLLGIDSSLNFAVMGAVVLVGVLADQIFQNRSRKRASH